MQNCHGDYAVQYLRACMMSTCSLQLTCLRVHMLYESRINALPQLMSEYLQLQAVCCWIQLYACVVHIFNVEKKFVPLGVVDSKDPNQGTARGIG